MIDELFSKLLMEFLKNKETALAGLIKDLYDTQKQGAGLDKFIENIDSADMNEDNIRQKFKTLMKVIRKQNSINIKLLVLISIYASSSDFDANVARILNKMGKGNEALHQMFKNKMRGL